MRLKTKWTWQHITILRIMYEKNVKSFHFLLKCQIKPNTLFVLTWKNESGMFTHMPSQIFSSGEYNQIIQTIIQIIREFSFLGQSFP